MRQNKLRKAILVKLLFLVRSCAPCPGCAGKRKIPHLKAEMETAALDLIRDGVLIFRDNRVTYANKALEILTKLPKGQLIGMLMQ